MTCNTASTAVTTHTHRRRPTHKTKSKTKARTMMKTTKSMNKKQVRFSDRSLLSLVDNLNLNKEQASKLWYTQDETDLFKAWLSVRVRQIHSELRSHGELLDDDLVDINAAAILGLEKYLTPELIVEYKERRVALKRAVLTEHRCQRMNRRISLDSDADTDSVRLALVSARHSQWARERARAAALFLENDVKEDIEEMNLQATAPRQISAEADAAGGNLSNNYKRMWSSAWNSVRNNIAAQQTS